MANEKVSLLTREQALLCGQVIQAALPDTSFYLRPGAKGGGDVLWVHLPGDEEYSPLLSVLEAGQFIRRRLPLMGGGAAPKPRRLFMEGDLVRIKPEAWEAFHKGTQRIPPLEGTIETIGSNSPFIDHVLIRGFYYWWHARDLTLVRGVEGPLP